MINYLDRVKWYYKKFSNSSTTHVNGKEKSDISISGKITRKNLLFWLIFSSFFVVIQLVNENKFSYIKFIFILFFNSYINYYNYNKK